MEGISNMNLSYTVYMDRIHIKWTKYNNLDNVRYMLIRKKASKPFFNQSDGILIYDGNELECDDITVRNGCLYYYRLFIFPDSNNIHKYISDSKCIIRCIAIKENEWVNYGSYLYKSIPRDVRFQDSQINLKEPSKNFPLKRFFNLCAYAFNKVNVYDDLEIEQIDIENCDEAYLPYHAKWMNCLYDERFGADINRLILKTMEEAEPYMGTMVGLKYILQRIFKSEVEIKVSETKSCVTNSGALIACNLYTNLQRVSASVLSIKLHFDNSNQWLSNMQMTDSIMKIILNYCALRTRFEIVFNVVMTEEYDRNKMSDYYLHDVIYEVVNEELTTTIQDEIRDYLVDDIGDLEKYLELVLVMHSTTNGDGRISNTLITNSDIVGRVDEILVDTANTSDSELLQGAFCDDNVEIVLYLPYVELYETTPMDYFVESVSDVIADSYDGILEMQLDSEHPFNILENVTNGISFISDTLKTNAHDGSLEYVHDEIKAVVSDVYGKIPVDDFQQELLVDIDSYEKQVEDYMLDKRFDVYSEFSKLMDFGITNSMDARLSRNFLTNVLGDRSEMLIDKSIYPGDEQFIGLQYDDLTDSLSRAIETEAIGDYGDEEITSCIRTRPVSLTCSECAIGKTLFTTDNLY